MDCQPTPTLRTARLLLTPMELADAAVIQRLFPHWDVVRYLDRRVPWPYPADGARVYVRDVVLPAMARGEEWHWMIRLASAPEDAIGNISLFDQPGNHRGFWLAPAWQGHGYMSEACEAVSRFWFQTLEKPLMQVPKAVPNGGSRRISEREGMRLVGRDEGHFVSGVLPRETWELTREEWLARHADD